MLIIKYKPLLLTLCTLIFCCQLQAQEVPQAAKGPINVDKNIFVSMTLPPNGFDLSSNDGSTFIFVSHGKKKLADSILLRLFKPQKETALESKNKLIMYQVSECNKDFIKIKNDLKKESKDEKTGTANVIENKISNKDGYDLLEFAFVCHITAQEHRLLYGRYYFGPSGVAEVVYKKYIDKMDKEENTLKEMETFIDSFISTGK